MPHLIVIYGPPVSGKTSLARELADALDGKSSVVSIDAILQEAIRNPDKDVLAELEMVHIQARLLVANFLKNRYHVVLEGAFCFQRDGVLHHREHEIGQIVALMRNLAPAPLVVGLSAPASTLRHRLQAAERSLEVEPALAVSSGIRAREDGRALALNSEVLSTPELAQIVLDRLAGYTI
jgi:adenylate kinase family enzyme